MLNYFEYMKPVILTLGSFKDTTTAMATKMSPKEVNLRSFNLYRDYSNSFTFSNASELFLSKIPKNHIQVQKEKENLPVAYLRPP